MEKRIRYLYRKYLNSQCSRAEFEELFEHIRQGEGHEDAEAELSRLYDEQIRKKSFRFRPFAIAAALMIMAGTWVVWSFFKHDNPLTAAEKPVHRSIIDKTERSEYKYLLLPDSTQVWLNAASTLEFGKQFGSELREVILKGEAFFDVKKADQIPFIIYTGKVSTVVLGTAFNIKAYPDQQKITVSVKRGKVKVNYSDNKVAMLTHGQQLSIGKGINLVKQKTVKDEEASAWQEGKLIYDDYRIADIVNELEKIYNTDVLLSDETIGNVSISTSFKREDGLRSGLELICRLTDKELEWKNGTYIIK